jgi:predicted O-methyltransferase YrrM
MFPLIQKDSYGVPRATETDVEPPPWYPVKFVEWLEPRLTKDMWVFEWGAGHSTLWFKRRVRFVTGIEHHVHWMEAMSEIKHRGIDNFAVRRYSQDDPFYWEVINECLDTTYQLIVVDGVNRNECIHEAVKALDPRGVIILDNSDSEAKEGQRWLREQGFSEKVFSGVYSWARNGEVHSTTVFYKDGNCLGL